MNKGKANKHTDEKTDITLYNLMFYLKIHFYKKIIQHCTLKCEILLIKYAKPNQTTHFVRYNRGFFITELDCKGFYGRKR